MGFNNINDTESSFSHSVVIPIDPRMILTTPKKEKSVKISTALPGNSNEESPSKQTNGDSNGNYFNNSNGNNEILDNPSHANKTNTTVVESNDLSNFSSSEYSQSPFNPLLLSMTQNDIINTSSVNENEELSLASNQFKLFVHEALKKVSNTGNSVNSESSSLKARLIIPPTNAIQDNARWGLKISGSRADLVLAAKKEIMRSPSLLPCSDVINDEEVDLETSLRTSMSIESLLFEEGGSIGVVEQVKAKDSDSSSIDYPVLAELSGLIFGPRHHIIKSILANYNCKIEWEDSLSFLPTGSTVNMKVSGPDAKAVACAILVLKDRSERVKEHTLTINTLVIDSGKLDWIFASGAIKQIDEALWKCGGSLTHLEGNTYQMTCLSVALLNSCLKKVHEILSSHQSVNFVFRFRNDFRDFSTKCSAIFESLAQSTDCSVSQKCLNDRCVEVEIGGKSRDLARALLRLETHRSEIFESGSNDLKLVERRLRLHVPAEIREFICGKKDGKLNRIIKDTGVNILLNSVGGDSMYVDLVADDPIGVNFCANALLHALRLIEGELPAELTFHVPEVHHKRMIGHGGKVIQRIMKKWGVYVKFMNGHETFQSNQVSDPLMRTQAEDSCVLDNVVVKTPGKNGSALKAIKEEIFEECSVSEITGKFDPEAFKALKRAQSCSKTRVSVSLSLQHRPMLSNLLKLLESSKSSVRISLFQATETAQEDKLILEGEKREILTVATLNPFDLLNEDASTTTASVKKPVVVAATNSKPVVSATKVSGKPVAVAPAGSAKKSSNNTAELNSNVTEKTPLRRNNNNARRTSGTESSGNERQERRRSDRHSRTGYKQDGEKRLTSGKGSWGKAVENGEEHVTVDESVAIAEAVEGVEIAEEDQSVETAEPVVPHLTLAQYQASLKKPVVSSNVTRKVNTTLAKDQIVKKEAEVFVFPEIVKKSASVTGKKASGEKAASIDFSKYISVKAVSSVEPRVERSDRPERPARNFDNRRSATGNNNARSSNNNRNSTPSNNNNKRDSTAPTTTKFNLNDDRSFPVLGSK